jgi:hypothetical protein
MEAVSLLHYRPWRGQFLSPAHTVWPIARSALGLMFRRKLFWALYALALLIFLMFFFGQHMLAWAEMNLGEHTVPLGGVRVRTDWLRNELRNGLQLNGSGVTYSNFFWYQGYMVMALLALAGAMLVGNDFQFGSLPFYLSKPLHRWHYLAGKGLAVAVLVNLMTTLPAVILFLQYGLLDDSWDYFIDRDYYAHHNFTGLGGMDLGPAGPRLLLGILGYGLLLTVVLSLMLVATASWLRRTVPMIMVWTTLFIFFRLLGSALVYGLHYDPRWRLIDVWNDLYVVGLASLGMPHPGPRYPEVIEAALVLGVVCIVCLSYLNLRIRAVEIVR